MRWLLTSRNLVEADVDNLSLVGWCGSMVKTQLPARLKLKKNHFKTPKSLRLALDYILGGRKRNKMMLMSPAGEGEPQVREISSS